MVVRNGVIIFLVLGRILNRDSCIEGVYVPGLILVIIYEFTKCSEVLKTFENYLQSTQC